jgi:hypothetical protein
VHCACLAHPIIDRSHVCRAWLLLCVIIAVARDHRPSHARAQCRAWVASCIGARCPPTTPASSTPSATSARATVRCLPGRCCVGWSLTLCSLLLARRSTPPRYWTGRRRSTQPGYATSRTGAGRSSSGAASVASFVAAVLTEIYLCNVCSCQEILRRNGRG